MNHRFQRLSTPTMFPSFFDSFNSFKSYPFAHILGNSFAVLALTEKRRSDEGRIDEAYSAPLDHLLPTTSI